MTEQRGDPCDIPNEMRERLAEGETLFQQGAVEEAIQAFEDVLEEVPHWADGWNDLGAVHYSFGRKEEAEECFRWALSLDPRSVDAVANLARLLQENGRLEEATALIPTLEALAPQDEELRYLKERLNIPATPFGSIIARTLPSATIAQVGDDNPSLAEELRRQGMIAAAPDETPEAIVSTNEVELSLAGLPDGTRLLRLGDETAVDALSCEEAKEWTEIAAFAPHDEGGWVPSENRGSRPIQCRVFEKGSDGRIADDFPLHPLSALVIDWERKAGRAHRWMRAALRGLGVTVLEAEEELCASLGAGNSSQGLAQILRQLRPSTVFVEASLPGSNEMMRSILSLGIPVVAAGIPTPEATLPGVVPMPWPPQERQMGEAVLQAFRALGPSLSQDMRETESSPMISVVAAQGESESVLPLLQALRDQSLPACCFEVVLVSTGDVSASVAAEIDAGSWPFAISSLEGEGGARSRNLGWRASKAEFCLFLDANSRPAKDCLLRHLIAQLNNRRASPGKQLSFFVQGSLSFDREQRKTPIVNLIHRSRVLRGSPSKDRKWLGLRSDNCSLPRAALETMDGFDESYVSGFEMADLADRLAEKMEVSVNDTPRIRAERNAGGSLRWFLDEGERQGKDLRKLWERRGVFESLPACRRSPDRSYWLDLRVTLESAPNGTQKLESALSALEGKSEKPISEEINAQEALQECWTQAVIRGVLTSERRAPATSKLPLREGRCSVIIPNLNGFPHVRNTITSLREHGLESTEIIVVDNGSSDGSREWLEKQNDLKLISLQENLGAPTARNRGLMEAHGETVLFCDNDVVFTPRWREHLLAHMESWSDIGMVGPMSDYVTGSQRTSERPLPGEKLDAFAERFHREHEGKNGYTLRMISFCVLVRRSVLEQIGGFDERFNPWGFEDDDLSLRAAAAGWQLRVAGDVFIRHLGSQTSKSAKLDYNQILLDNWEAFKSKWGIPSELPYGSSYDAMGLVSAGFDARRHHCALESSPAEAAL